MNENDNSMIIGVRIEKDKLSLAQSLQKENAVTSTKIRHNHMDTGQWKDMSNVVIEKTGWPDDNSRLSQRYHGQNQ